jgi:hypothetical protein
MIRAPSAPPFDKPDRYRRHPGTDRESIGAVGAVPDHLADELMAKHDVAVRVVERPPRRVIDTEIRVVHEMHVRRADRGTQCAQQELAGTGYRVGSFADLQLATPQHHCSHLNRLLAILEYSR